LIYIIVGFGTGSHPAKISLGDTHLGTVEKGKKKLGPGSNDAKVDV